MAEITRALADALDPLPSSPAAAEPGRPAAPVRDSGPITRTWFVCLYDRSEPSSARDPRQPFPWYGIFFIGGTPEDHAAALLALRDDPALRTPPPWWRDPADGAPA